MILRVIHAFDDAVQKRFDAVMHAIMRSTGITKRGLRRHGNAAMVAALLGEAVGWRLYKPDDGPVFLVVQVALAAMYYTGYVRDDRRDAEAERSGTARSTADAAGRSAKIFGYTWTVMWLVERVFDVVWLGLVYETSRLLFDLAWLYQGYLCGTSPAAPKKIKKETAEPGLARVEVRA